MNRSLILHDCLIESWENPRKLTRKFQIKLNFIRFFFVPFLTMIPNLLSNLFHLSLTRNLHEEQTRTKKKTKPNERMNWELFT